MWGFLLCWRERRDVAELAFSSSALQEKMPPGFVMACYFRPFSPAASPATFLGTSQNVLFFFFWVIKNVTFFERKNDSLHFGAPIKNFLRCTDGPSLCCFMLDQSWPAVCDQRWAVMPWNDAWWNTHATGEDERLVGATNGLLFFSSMHLWSCHWEGRFHPCHPPPAHQASWPYQPSTPWAVLMFRIRAYCCAGTMAMGASLSSCTSSYRLTIRSLQSTNRKLPHWKEIQRFLSVLRVWFFYFILFFLCVLLKFPGERSASYSAEIYHDPPDSEVSLHNTDFFHRCLFLFWALISCVSFVRPFTTLRVPSIIHNLQLLPQSHSATYLQTIIFLFWNVWKRGCPAATSGYGCWESRFHIFAQRTYLVLWLWENKATTFKVAL